METLFTWLHLSDLHVRATESTGSSALARAVRPSGGFGQVAGGGSAPPPGMYERLLQALRDDLVENAEQRPDALMVTGDVSLRGTREDFIAARRWLVETARALGLGPERIFVVPGNHDVERDASARNEGLELRLLADLREGRRRLESRPGEARGPEPPRRPPRALLRVRLRLRSGHRPSGRAPGMVPRRPGARGAGRAPRRPVHALALDGRGRPGRAPAGHGPLNRALATFAPGELVVALSHHPVRGGWLADEATAEAWMTAHAHVHLTGQIHNPSAEAARGGTPGGLRVDRGRRHARALNQPEARRRLGWSLVQVMRSAEGATTLRSRRGAGRPIRSASRPTTRCCAEATPSSSARCGSSSRRRP